MRHRYFKGFTLIEVVMVMLLTSVVLAMTYAVYRMVSNYDQQLKIKMERQEQWELANRTLNRDVFRCTYLYLDQEDNMICQQGDLQINYHIINNSLLIRSVGGQQDTLLRSFRINMKGIVLDEQEYPSLLTSVDISVRDSTKQVFVLSAEKHYSSEQLFKHWHHAGN